MKKISKVLIANRGEIAARIAKTLRKMDIQSVGLAIASEKNAPYVLELDAVMHLDMDTLSAFLDMDLIVSKAKQAGADAIHPGYGFLSENADFAQKVIDAGLVWIGPDPTVIQALGDKNQAKAIAKQAGVSTLEAAHETVEEDPSFEEQVANMPLPLMLKPMMGGGGKGMQILDDLSQLPTILTESRRLAKASFGDSRLLAEPFIVKPRHIEVQIVRDAHGNAYALGERDCTTQRRHQKVIEEAPSVSITRSVIEKIIQDALLLANHTNYTNAGTFEFLVDDQENYFFMEANTRLQVEHPVTEMIYDVDLVALQIRIAQGEKIADLNLTPQGHAIEIRIYAENPDQNFLPSTGLISHLSLPQENACVQLHHNLCLGQNISSTFDPMLCKLVVWGQTRQKAIEESLKALSQLNIVGVHTNHSFAAWVLAQEDFQQAKHHTQWVDQNHAGFLFDRNKNLDRAVRVWQYQQWERYQRSWIEDPWNAYEPSGVPSVTHLSWNQELISDQYVTTQADPLIDLHECIQVANQWWTSFENHRYVLTQTPLEQDLSDSQEQQIKAPMSGTVVTLHVEEGNMVEKDQVLIEMEAMKMQYKLTSPIAGHVKEINCALGDIVQSHQVLVEIEPA